jgi:hypothetical protein
VDHVDALLVEVRELMKVVRLVKQQHQHEHPTIAPGVAAMLGAIDRPRRHGAGLAERGAHLRQALPHHVRQGGAGRAVQPLLHRHPHRHQERAGHQAGAHGARG